MKVGSISDHRNWPEDVHHCAKFGGKRTQHTSYRFLFAYHHSLSFMNLQLLLTFLASRNLKYIIMETSLIAKTNFQYVENVFTPCLNVQLPCKYRRVGIFFGGGGGGGNIFVVERRTTK